MNDKVLLLCKNVLDKMTEKEILKYEWLEEKIMSDLLRNLISDISIFVQMKTNKLKDYSDKRVEQMEQKMRDIIKLYIRMRKNPKLTIKLINEYKKTGWLEYSEVIDIYREFNWK